MPAADSTTRRPERPASLLARAVDSHPAAAAIVVALANLAVKLPGLSKRSLWLDEAWTVALGLHRPSAIVFAAAHDENPPLYNIFMAGWMRMFGTSEAAVRMPSVLASVACAVLLLRFVRRFYGAEAAVYVSLLFLAAEPQLHYAREARAFAIIGFLCVLSFHLYLRNLERPGWPTAIVLGIVNAAAMYTHYTIGLAFVAQGLCALAFRASKRRAFRLYVASQLLALVLFAPFVGSLFSNLPQAGRSWLPPADGRMLHDVAQGIAGSKSVLYWGLALIVGSALFRHRRQALGGDDAARWLLVAAAWAIVPILLAFAVSQRSPIFHVRYLLFASLGWIVLIAALLSSMPWPAWARVAAALALTISTAKGIARAPLRGPDWRGAAAIVREVATGRSVVVVAREVECIPFAYYTRPEVLPALFGEEGAYDPDRLYRQLSAHRVRCLQSGGIPLPASSSPDRIVLVLSNVERPAFSHILRDVEGAGYSVARTHRLVGVWVGVLDRRPAAEPPAVAAPSGVVT